jgi:hypothetical protein
VHRHATATPKHTRQLPPARRFVPFSIIFQQRAVGLSPRLLRPALAQCPAAWGAGGALAWVAKLAPSSTRPPRLPPPPPPSRGSTGPTAPRRSARAAGAPAAIRGAGCNHTRCTLQPYAVQAATIRGAGCNLTRCRLQPYAVHAATIRGAGCNLTRCRQQPYAVQAATVRQVLVPGLYTPLYGNPYAYLVPAKLAARVVVSPAVAAVSAVTCLQPLALAPQRLG